MDLGSSPNESLVGIPGGRSRLSTPALVLDLDILERNIAAMAAHCEATGQALRPHSKSHKSVAIARTQKAAGSSGVCCATIRETEIMVGAGIESVLTTSPVSTPTKIARLMALHDATEHLMVVSDTSENVAALAEATAGCDAGRPLAVLVDFDVGLHRTGAADAAAAVALAQQIDAADSLRFAGVQAYYGHLQHIADYAERVAAVAGESERLTVTVAALTEAGLAPPLVTGGGTGTHDIDHRDGVLTELQAGSYIFADVQYNAVALTESEPRPFGSSLTVAASVVNNIHDTHAVIDAGLKSFATDGPAPEYATGAPIGSTYRYMGDEHGAVVFGEANDRLEVGAPVSCVVPHCDPTVNLWDVYHCVRGDTLVDIWRVDARGNP
jgi:D-serine deaminase-like pyridoxal phosphate-dependent protein